MEHVSKSFPAFCLGLSSNPPAPHSPLPWEEGSPGAQDVTLPEEGLSHCDPPLSSTSSESPFPALSLGGGEVCRMPALCGKRAGQGGQMGPSLMGICPARLMGGQGCEGPQAPPASKPVSPTLTPSCSLFSSCSGSSGERKRCILPCS